MAILAAVGFILVWTLLERLTAGAFYGTLIISDISLYQQLADAWAGGATPYAEATRNPYPPGAIVPFLLPRLVSGADAQAYEAAFKGLMMLCGAGSAAVVAILTRARLIPGVHARVATLFVVLSPLLIGPIILSRYDLVPALLSVIAIAIALTGRIRVAIIVVAIAVSVKVYPVVLVPLLLALAWRRGGRREAGITLGFGLVTGAVIVLPFLVSQPDGVISALTDQVARPLQVESIGAALLVVLHGLTGLPIAIVTSFGSQNVDGGATGPVALLLGVLLVVSLLATWLRFARGTMDGAAFVTAAAAAVTAFIAFGKVLSPQYLVWLIPLVPLVPGRRGLAAMGLLALGLLLTVAYFPAGYFPYVERLDQGSAWTILARDVVLVGLFLTLLLPWGRIGAWIAHVRTDPVWQRRAARLVPDAVTLLVLLAVGGFLLRMLWLNKPDGSLIFDETYYVNAARVINGWAVPEGAPYATAAPFLDPNQEHPPLGKAIIAASMGLLGDGGLGWRLPSVIAGVVSLWAVWSIVRGLGGRASLAVLAATILSLDILSFVHGRIGTLDMIPIAFSLIGVRLAIGRRWAWAGAFLALAVLVKIPSIYALAVALAWLALPALERLVRERPTSLVHGIRQVWPELRGGLILSGAFVGVFLVGLWVLDLRYTTFTSPLDHLAHILRYGFALADRYTPNSITSEPWQWLVNDGQFDYLRVNVNTLVNDEIVGSRASVQFRALLNPVLIGLTALALPWAAWAAWKRRDPVASWGLLWTAGNILPYVILAIVSSRVMYFYYILPAIPGLAILAASFLIGSRMPRIVIVVWMIAMAALFIAWFPFRQIP